MKWERLTIYKFLSLSDLSLQYCMMGGGYEFKRSFIRVPVILSIICIKV